MHVQYVQCFMLNIKCSLPTLFLYRYPEDVQAFSRSGLRGAWQSERTGKRMKLKQPDTWERCLSQQGNKASTWEGLIGVLHKRTRMHTHAPMHTCIHHAHTSTLG